MRPVQNLLLEWTVRTAGGKPGGRGFNTHLLYKSVFTLEGRDLGVNTLQVHYCAERNSRASCHVCLYTLSCHSQQRAILHGPSSSFKPVVTTGSCKCDGVTGGGTSYVEVPCSITCTTLISVSVFSRNHHTLEPLQFIILHIITMSMHSIGHLERD